MVFAVCCIADVLSVSDFPGKRVDFWSNSWLTKSWKRWDDSDRACKILVGLLLAFLLKPVRWVRVRLVVCSDQRTDDVRRATSWPQPCRRCCVRLSFWITVALRRLSDGDRTTPDDGWEVARRQHERCQGPGGQGDEGLDRFGSVGVVGVVVVCVWRLTAFDYESFARSRRNGTTSRRQQHLTDTNIGTKLSNFLH